MYTFNQFLQEARRNPELNPKVSAYDALLQYKNDSDIYISFRDIKKIGIKPLSYYNTPNGVYTYPLKEFWKMYNVDKVKDLGSVAPFAGNMPYIFVIKAKNTKGFVQDMYSDYTSKNYDTDLQKIKNMLSNIKDVDMEYFNSLLSIALSNTKEKNAVMSFWNLTRILSSDTKFKKLLSLENADTQAWNNLLRRLGYTGFADKSAKGYIHSAEPLQAVFLTSNEYVVLDMIENKSRKARILKNFSWKSGTFSGKLFENGVWENGRWEGEEFSNSVWKKGVWVNGYFSNSIWYNGTWMEGSFENGSWKNGIWHSGIWYNGTWENGIWKDGAHLKGDWIDGVWKHGRWHGGEWKKGEWVEGEIYSKRFKAPIFSVNPPPTFYELEKLATSIYELEKESLIKQ